jgi:hypothetical protein
VITMFRGIKGYVLDWLMSGMVEEENYDRNCEDAHSMTGHTIGPMNEEPIENWTPPARYLIRAGGSEIWCDRWKFGPNSIDVFRTETIGGQEKAVSVSIYESTFMIFDFETPLTSETFDHTRKSDIDSMTRPMKEAKDPYKAKMRIDKKPSVPFDSNVMSPYV